MLIEIFSDKVYEETPCDPNRGVKSKRVPSTQISERGPIGDYYLKARDFLVSALDTSYFAISTGGSYMLEIECDDSGFNPNTSITSLPVCIDEHKFSFKFNSLRDTIDNDKASTIHGEVIIDKLFNVISFKRDRVPAYSTNNCTCTYTQKVVTDSTSTSGKRTEWVKIEEDDRPFDSSCQQEEPCDDTKGAGSDTTGKSESIELSKNSFSVKGSEITVKDPELKIGTVDGGSFSIDAEKQKMQDEFLANMSRKISKRNRRRGTK